MFHSIVTCGSFAMCSFNPSPSSYSTSYSSSTSGGLGSVSSAGHDSVLSTSMPERTFIHDDVFNPDKTRLNAAPKSPKHGLKALPEHESKTGLEDSYYEECGVESPRYAPGKRLLVLFQHFITF